MEKRLVHENEKSFYILCLVLSIFIYIALIVSLVGIIYILVGFLITFFLQGISIGHIRNNGVKLTERQFPEIYNRANQIAQEMGIRKLPDMYIVQSGGILNAFATHFLGRSYVVLYSEIVEIAKNGQEDELNFIIAHELAHIKRKHVTKHILILPALWIPFLGNAYSRACEFTCDRIAAIHTNNSVKAINAIAILAVGKRLFNHMDILEYIRTSRAESGFFIWFSNAVSTHPPLPKRIEEIQHHSNFFENRAV